MRAGAILQSVLLVIACEPVIERGGPRSLAPDPAGVMEGTVIYIGPRPACQRDAGEGARRLVGRVVLTLFAYDNPPPPSGAATSAMNLLVVPANELFQGSGDCMPEDAPDPYPITRSAPFVWPEIPLAETGDADYQVRGFFDYDEDFIPFFAVRNQPSKGDVIGAAFVNAAVPNPEMLRVRFGSREVYPSGQVVAGVTVTLAAPVRTERPMFGVVTGPLSAEATIPATKDPTQLMMEIWALTGMQIELVEAADTRFGDTLDAAGIEFDFDASGYAWFLEGVDANGDGATDPHPILGANGLPWQMPMVLLKRARTPAEVAARVPEVLFVGAVVPEKQVLYPAARIAVPPIAAVDLKANDSTCRVPYIPPNNLPPYYSGVVDCQELPSGRYDINILHGLAAGVEQDADTTVSDTGTIIVGGTYSGQAWSIPNELGPADTVYKPGAPDQLPATSLLSEQGPAARFAVIEPDPQNNVRTGCSATPDPVPAACCAAVAHLCDVPLCSAAADADGMVIRQGEAAANGTLTCVPFEMPASCCL